MKILVWFCIFRKAPYYEITRKCFDIYGRYSRSTRKTYRATLQPTYYSYDMYTGGLMFRALSSYRFLISCFTGALSYAELGSVVNKSGGEFNFYRTAFADMHKFWGPLPSFIYSWVCIMYIRPAEVAIIILTFAEYSVQPFSTWTEMSPENIESAKKIVAIIALGKGREQ